MIVSDWQVQVFNEAEADVMRIYNCRDWPCPDWTLTKMKGGGDGST